MEPLGPFPIRLDANQPCDRFYRGGAQIAHFRETVAHLDRIPEDWIGSTTSVRGEEPAGLTVLPDGRFLTDAVAVDPDWWLGGPHVEAYGADTKLLVKLLDAGQRLPVHAHPSDDFAGQHLGQRHGKAEAWYILTPGVVYLGLTRDIAPSELEALVDSQAIQELLSSMHKIQVEPGDRVYVPPGVLHAIGAGVFLAEVQEPADLSILLEWEGFAVDGPGTGHLGLGFPVALTAVETAKYTGAQVEKLVVRKNDSGAGLPVAADKYFRLTRVEVAGRASLEEGFTILIVLSGTVTVNGDWGSALVEGGSTWLVPAAVSGRTLTGDGTLLAVYPPQHD